MARLAQGHTRGRRPTAGWDLADLAGAGGLRATTNDLVAFLRAQFGGAGELAEAIRLTRTVTHPVNRFTSAHLGWLSHRQHPGQGSQLRIWHNGRTGGFACFIGFDPDRTTAVAVLSNTARSVDAAAFELLGAAVR